METINLNKYQTIFLNKLAAQGKSQNTLKNYKTDLNIFQQFLAQKGRAPEISELTLQEVKEYDRFLEKKYNSPNSIRRRVQALRIFFDFLIEQEKIDHNPVKKMVVCPKVVEKPNPTPFNKIQQLKAYLQSQFEQNTDHDQLLASRNLVMFYLIYGAGLKVSDIEKLSLAHITLAKGQYRVLVSHQKKDPYTVNLPLKFNEYFEQYKSLLEQGKERDEIEFHQLMFNANPFKILKGGLSSRGIEVIFKDFSQQIDYQVTARALRQACIFKWMAAGIPFSRIKEWMGVQPQYSLKPFESLMQEQPEKYAFIEV